MGSSSQVLKELDRQQIKELASLLSPDDPALLMKEQQQQQQQQQLKQSAYYMPDTTPSSAHTKPFKPPIDTMEEDNYCLYFRGTESTLSKVSHLERGYRALKSEQRRTGCAASLVASPSTRSINSY